MLFMMTKQVAFQPKLQVYTIDELMPKSHFLRKLLKVMGFRFVYEKVAHLYAKTGRPSIDPEVVIKCLLIGYLYGIDSERRLMEDISVNIAYRWF